MSVIDLMKAGPKHGPRGPDVTAKELLTQFWLDLYGKEVQSASTYSYTWMADQMGHVCLGIVILFGLAFFASYGLPYIGIDPSWSAVTGFVLGAMAVSYWEYRAYRSSEAGATGLFPLDRKLLRDNAIIATAYMVMGLGIGFAFHQSAPWSALGFIVLALLAIVCAPPWLRQKIIWQKAALPLSLPTGRRTADDWRGCCKAAPESHRARSATGCQPLSGHRRRARSAQAGPRSPPASGRNSLSGRDGCAT